MADGPWAIALKNSEFPKRLQEVIRKKGEPEHIWREALLGEVYPLAKSKRRIKDVIAKEYRKKITVCMSDPDVMGYVRDGGGNHNPRYRRVVR